MSRFSQARVYRKSLSMAGVNGTLKNRFHNTVIQGYLFGETGTLTGINSLSGYMALPNYPTIQLWFLVLLLITLRLLIKRLNKQ